MEKFKKIIFVILFSIIVLLLLQVTSNASYSIDNMDIQATIEKKWRCTYKTNYYI